MFVNFESSSKEPLRSVGRGSEVCRLVMSLIVGIISLALLAPRACAGPVAGSWDSLFGVDFAGTDHAFVVGSKGLLLESDDAGKSWITRRLGQTVRAYDLYGVRFDRDGTDGWIVGEHGTVYRTGDRGRNWSKRTCPVADSLFKVAVRSANAACAVGANGALLCTEDGGANWAVDKFKDFTFFDVDVDSHSGLWAVGEYKTILFSTDWGRHWQLKAGGERVFTAPPYFAISLESQGKGILAALGPSFEQTSDDGKSWSVLPIKENQQVYSIFPLSGTAQAEFWIAGGQGYVGVLNDDHLDKIETGATTDLSDIRFAGDVGLTVGLQGTLVRLQKQQGIWKVSDDSSSLPVDQLSANVGRIVSSRSDKLSNTSK
jgi:photosystem II stability/assembly factor-like uncharacterized protein